MKKYLFIIIVSLVVGFLLSYNMLKEYDNLVLPTLSKSETVYLIQQGVYSSMENMNNNTKNITDYIYSQIDNMYYVYVGITSDSDNAIKIQKQYSFNTIVKKISLTNNEYLKTLKQLDIVLSETNDNDIIKQVIKEGLKKYQGG